MRLEGRCGRGDLRPSGRHTFLSCKELSQSLHRQVNKSAADLWRPWSPSLSGRCKMGIFRLLSLYPSNVLRNFSSAAAQREEEESEVSSGAEQDGRTEGRREGLLPSSIAHYDDDDEPLPRSAYF